MSACTTSPARTFVDGFAGLPLTRTCPLSHSWVAMGRVLTRRTAHNQRSIRVSSGIGCSHAALRHSVAWPNGARPVGRSMIIIVPYTEFVRAGDQLPSRVGCTDDSRPALPSIIRRPPQLVVQVLLIV